MLSRSLRLLLGDGRSHFPSTCCYDAIRSQFVELPANHTITHHKQASAKSLPPEEIYGRKYNVCVVVCV